MKKYLTILALILTAAFADSSLAQKTEVYISANSGLFSFTGPSASRTSQINTDYFLSAPLAREVTGYTNSVLGKLSGLSYGISSHIQRVSRGNFISGIGLSYEDLRSKVLIDKVIVTNNIAPIPENAVGKTILSNRFVNISPYLGYRIKRDQISLDLAAGFDLGYLLRSYEEGKAETVSDRVATTSLEREWGINLDVRPKLQATVQYQRTGVFASYARGLSNYYNEYDGGDFKATSQMTRFGITYRVTR
ncbi:outer membrane beta-barrel protein [Persicitalea jodogahamensis]|uniref:Outer membrane protein beta-barrel domain-containing protein n=1 Tax=Persicitalea jodogahamensis TaxID=402147 RepID=A0A8J3D2P3_9BACT|nr:outer membrane beta-barrel protein [Persicitalea jodogahamensis]GHB59817.1 hypothetical protein GCM10007390_11910 [Persicitalea jodogahamensis]